ncbi:tRNA dihydrouridine synthase DusB [Candidatus Woesearchaeota archaeon]|nr:tRNA dihydrouridine synthase DusB [Candidatus Woesearchaeota archaeon]
MSYHIGNVRLDSKLILAPMAGVNCAAFRLLCKGYGAGLVSTPMLVINQIVAAPEKIINQACFLKQEKPVSVQLVGSDSRLAEQATRIIEPYADIIDVNLGCPEKDILALKAGSFLVKHPDQIKKIVTPVINNTNKPVTAKIRIGWDDKSINTLEVVKILEDLGVSAIAIHARTKEEKYSGRAHWEEIMKAKEKATIPIIGNGDVFKPGSAKAMIEQTRCDFVMIGRGCMGNPFIFKRTNALLATGSNIEEPSEQEKKKCFMKFLEYYENYEKIRSFTELKQQAMWFTKGMTGARDLRYNLMKAKGVNDILRIYKAKL